MIQRPRLGCSRRGTGIGSGFSQTGAGEFLVWCDGDCSRPGSCACGLSDSVLSLMTKPTESVNTTDIVSEMISVHFALPAQATVERPRQITICAATKPRRAANQHCVRFFCISDCRNHSSLNSPIGRGHSRCRVSPWNVSYHTSHLTSYDLSQRSLSNTPSPSICSRNVAYEIWETRATREEPEATSTRDSVGIIQSLMHVDA